jgi:hypothetical protein
VEKVSWPLIGSGLVLIFGGIALLSNGLFNLHVAWVRGTEVAVALACILSGWLIGRSLARRSRA